MTDELKNLNLGNGEYFGPDDELPFEIKNKCYSDAISNLKDNDGFDLIRNLEKDEEDLREPGQEISFVSFVGPYDSLRAKHKELYFNVRGACGSVDEARTKLEDIGKKTKYDIYTFEMYTWIAIPPNPVFMEDNDAHEKYLNKLISNHRLRMEVDKELFEARKKLMTSNRDINNNNVLSIEDINDDEEQITAEASDVSEEASESNKVDAVVDLTPQPTKEEIRAELAPEINIESFATQNGVKEEKFQSNEKLDECKEYGQEWAVVSIVGDNTIGHALKIKGFYETEEQAKEKTKELGEIDPTFNNYVVESYRWLKADINPDDIEDQIYDNEELNAMSSKHKEGKKKALKHLKQNPPGSTPAPAITATAILDELEK